MDIQYFEKLWSEDKTSKSNENYWDNRAADFNNSIYSGHSNERFDTIIDFLAVNHMLKPENSVLDIGCGPGKFAIEFAKRSMNVTAIDISEQMLGFAVKNAESENLFNLSFRKINWEEFALEVNGWNKKFDLVTAINCPGINNRNTLEKMISASRNYCFLTNFVERTESVKDFIVTDILNLGENRFYNNTIYSIVNILWLLGYYPGISYLDSDWERNMSVEAAYAYYCTTIQSKGGLIDEQKESMKNYLEESAEYGSIKEKVQSKTAFIYWQV